MKYQAPLQPVTSKFKQNCVKMLGYKSFIEESANITAMDSSECWINSILILFNACHV